MSETKHEYDFSDYPTDHPFYDETNKKVIGKMKDDCAGAPKAEYIGLRPFFRLIGKAKGTKKYVIKNMMAQMAHFSFPYYFTIPNSEFRIPNSEFRIPNSEFRNS